MRLSILIVILGLLLLVMDVRASDDAMYRYDALGRVSSVCYVGSGKIIKYTYDQENNRTSVVTSNVNCNSNSIPVAISESYSGYYEIPESIPISVLDNDSDPDGDTLTLVSASCSTGCNVSITSGRILNITGNTVGVKTATYTISDGRGGTATATVTIDRFYAEPSCGPFLC